MIDWDGIQAGYDAAKQGTEYYDCEVCGCEKHWEQFCESGDTCLDCQQDPELGEDELDLRWEYIGEARI